MKFLRPLVALLRVSFKDEASTRSAYNAALSYTLGNALKGIAPNFEIDYTKVLASSGNLNAAMNPGATSTQAGKIDFTWDNNYWDFGAETTDLVVLVAYYPLLGKALSVIGDATRASGSQTMNLPAIFSGQQVHTYIGFCNKSKTEFSNGEFLETVAVA